MSLSAKPSVSVLIATLDRPERREMLDRAIDAVMKQTYDGPIECVITFDKSEPHGFEEDVPAGRTLRTVKNTERTPGLAGARNTGVLNSTGEVIAFCDDDDMWLPTKLERQLAAMAANPGAEIATTGINVVYKGESTPRIFGADRITMTDLLRSRVMEAHPSSVIVTRAAFDRIGFVDEFIPGSYAEDYEWMLRGVRETEVLHIQEPLVDVYWNNSYFSGRWDMIVDALTYLLERVPEFEREPAGLARITGQIALANAGAGQHKAARSWARRTVRLNWRERRAYLALAVSTRMLSIKTVQKMAHAAGKGL